MAKNETQCRIIADIPVENLGAIDPFGFEPFVGSLASMATTAQKRNSLCSYSRRPVGMRQNVDDGDDKKKNRR